MWDWGWIVAALFGGVILAQNARTLAEWVAGLFKR